MGAIPASTSEQRTGTTSHPWGAPTSAEKQMGKDLRPSPSLITVLARSAMAWARRLLHQAASALFAFSASAAKPTASCTAMSASTLRSRVMPDFSMPFMKRL